MRPLFAAAGALIAAILVIHFNHGDALSYEQFRALGDTYAAAASSPYGAGATDKFVTEEGEALPLWPVAIEALPSDRGWYYDLLGCYDCIPPDVDWVIMTRGGVRMVYYVARPYSGRYTWLYAWDVDRGRYVRLYPWPKAYTDVFNNGTLQAP